MKRETLVGTIMHARTATEPMLLLDFAGEGSTKVAYVFGDPVTGAPSGQVVTIMKPVAWLEMETLHWDFAVHETLYPNHPLRLTPAERFLRLEAEMMSRVAGGRVIHRVSSYADLLGLTLTALVTAYFEAFKRDELSPALLGRHPGIRLFLDDNLQQHIQNHLDDGTLVDEYEEFFAQVVALLPEAVAVLKDGYSYRPIALNPIASLAGLRVVDFISFEEMIQIAKGDGFRHRLQAAHIRDAIGFGEILYARAGGSERWMSNGKTDDRTTIHPDSEFSAAALTVYELCRVCAEFPEIAERTLAGKARADAARASMLESGPSSRAVGELENALTELRAADAKAHVHDVLVDLDYLYSAAGDPRADACRREAAAIRAAD